MLDCFFIILQIVSSEGAFRTLASLASFRLMFETDILGLSCLYCLIFPTTIGVVTLVFLSNRSDRSSLQNITKILLKWKLKSRSSKRLAAKLCICGFREH